MHLKPIKVFIKPYILYLDFSKYPSILDLASPQPTQNNFPKNPIVDRIAQPFKAKMVASQKAVDYTIATALKRL